MGRQQKMGETKVRNYTTQKYQLGTVKTIPKGGVPNALNVSLKNSNLE